jgi:Holliday junction DNA helicase RuvA
MEEPDGGVAPMIAFLDGVVAGVSAGRVTLDVGGVGYEVLVPASVLSALPPTGQPARIHTRMTVRDDAIVLYGFSSPDERTLFDLLTGVTGVGPKVALAFLSTLVPDVLRRAVASGDAGALTVVPGVGKKVAMRVIVELRDTLGGGGELPAEGPLADVRDALLSLGLSAQEASEAMAGILTDGRPVEDLLRDALQRAGR